MNSNTLIFTSIAICFIILGFFYLDRSGYFDPMKEVIKTDTVFNTKTDTLWKDTTIVEKEIVPKIIVKTKIDTLFKENGETVQLFTEAKRFDKRLISNKDTADVQVYTSGIETSLDSLKMRLKTHREIVTNTVEVTKYVKERKRFIDKFHIQPQVGVGYGVLNKKFDTYVGVGIGFDIW